MDIHRIIPAVHKHIAAEDALTGGGEAVGVEEAAKRGVVVPTLQIVKSRLGIVVVTAVTDGVDVREGSGGAEDLAPCVVAVRGHRVSAGVQQHHHIALEVGDIVVPGFRRGSVADIPHQQCIRCAALVIEELQLRLPVSLRDQPGPLPGVQVLDGAGCIRQAQPAVVIGEAQSSMVGGGADTFQPPPVHPGHCCPVVPRSRVSDVVIGDGVAVVGRQQVRPLGKTGTVTSL